MKKKSLQYHVTKEKKSIEFLTDLFFLKSPVSLSDQLRSKTKHVLINHLRNVMRSLKNASILFLKKNRDYVYTSTA